MSTALRGKTTAASNQTSFTFSTHGDPGTNVLAPDDAGLERRLQAFSSTGGKSATVRASRLSDLGIESTIPERLKDGSFDYSSEKVTLSTTDVVITRQGAVKKARVLEYVEMMRNGDDITAIQVTDIVPGGGVWHLNGLHRLVAARILGRDITAQVWR